MISARATEIVRIAENQRAEQIDDLAIEEPLEIRVEGTSVSVVMRTPGHDRELAAGFLLTEGIIESAADLFDITSCVATTGDATRGNVVDAALIRPERFDLSRLTRHVFTSSSCGICSKASIDAVLQHREPLSSRVTVAASVVMDLPERLRAAQESFNRTGGLHACGLFDLEGNLRALREDVGRHNALDKLIGWALFERMLPIETGVLLLSGRASFEMMQKSHAAGIPVVAAIGAPSTAAVDFAMESGQTLAGFLRERTMNVYAHPNRIISAG
jgi:FdhD protein